MITKYLIMKALKLWLKRTGLENFGLLVAAFVFWFILPGMFASSIGFLLLGMCIGLNWQALKNLSDFDEKVMEKFEEVKDSIRGTVNGDKPGEGKDD